MIVFITFLVSFNIAKAQEFYTPRMDKADIMPDSIISDSEVCELMDIAEQTVFAKYGDTWLVYKSDNPVKQAAALHLLEEAYYLAGAQGGIYTIWSYGNEGEVIVHDFGRVMTLSPKETKRLNKILKLLNL